MKELTLKFRRVYHSYDYDKCNIDILMELLDIVLEMMKIVNNDDSDNIKKLASFIKVLSSDFCRDVINANVIDDIYTEQILAIFVEFDNKYEEKKCEVEDLPEQRVMTFTEKIKNKVKHIFHRDETPSNNSAKQNKVKREPFIYYTSESFEDDKDILLDEESDSEYNDKKLFSILKRTGDQTARLYNSIIKGQGDDDKILRELRDIQTSASVASIHYNKQISLLSMAVCKISDFLIEALSKKDYKIINDNERGLEESFEFMNKIHYSN